MAHCVVLGGGGFIGANLTVGLLKAGHTVDYADIHCPSDRHAAIVAAGYWHGGLGTGHETDLTDPDQVKRVVSGCDWVFHLAADMGGVGYFHSDADLGASLTNGQITGNVIRAVDGQRLFYAASACAYPIELMDDGPLTEDLLGYGTPDALYGAEKLHGLRLCSKVPDARVGVFDTIYGPLQEHEGRRMKFPAAVMTKALKARETGTLELWGDGSQRRAYLYIDDAVERIIRVMTADTYQGPVNIGAAGTHTCREVAEMALNIAGAQADIVLNPGEPSGVPTRELDHTKFATVYGPYAETSLYDGFTRFAGWLDR